MNRSYVMGQTEQTYKKIDICDLPDVAADMRSDILHMCHTVAKRKAHLGGSLSAVEILAVLYTQVMNIGSLLHSDKPWSLRDRFIMSKGHGALALYAAMKQVGLVSQDMLAGSMRGTDAILYRHPKRNIAYGIECSTGSLGMGLSYGIGLAESFCLRKTSQKVFVLVGDGECDEGSVWEGVAYAAHHCLDNLTLIVDVNKLQLDGKTDDILSLKNLKARLEAFGFAVCEVNGHDFNALNEAFCTPHPKKPLAVIAHTVKGKGVSFAENQVLWHDNYLSDELFCTALSEIAPYNKEKRQKYAQYAFLTRRHDLLAAPQSQDDLDSPSVLPLSYKIRQELISIGPKEGLGFALSHYADTQPELVFLFADCGLRAGAQYMMQKHPSACFEGGVAEQNLLVMAAAMAHEGLKVVAVSYAPFITARVLDQIRVCLGYMQAPVCLVGMIAGFAPSDLGATHTALEDIAHMRAVPHMQVYTPADSLEMAEELRLYLQDPKPSYIRMTVHEHQAPFHQLNWQPVSPKTMECICSGGDIALFVSGSLLSDAHTAVLELARFGIKCTLMHISAIKPLDEQSLDELLCCRLFVSIEEHNIIGGLGSALAEYLCALPAHPPLLRLGVNDCYLPADISSQERKICGLDVEGIVKAVRDRLDRLS